MALYTFFLLPSPLLSFCLSLSSPDLQRWSVWQKTGLLQQIPLQPPLLLFPLPLSPPLLLPLPPWSGHLSVETQPLFWANDLGPEWAWLHSPETPPPTGHWFQDQTQTPCQMAPPQPVCDTWQERERGSKVRTQQSQSCSVQQNRKKRQSPSVTLWMGE